MPDAIGPGTPLMCVKSCHCGHCGIGVDKGVLYFCEDIRRPTVFELIIYGPCTCGEFHDFIVLKEKDHAYCPTLFVPLGDPEAEIKETDEPASTKRIEDDCYDLPAQIPVKETENV